MPSREQLTPEEAAAEAQLRPWPGLEAARVLKEEFKELYRALKEQNRWYQELLYRQKKHDEFLEREQKEHPNLPPLLSEAWRYYMIPEAGYD